MFNTMKKFFLTSCDKNALRHAVNAFDNGIVKNYAINVLSEKSIGGNYVKDGYWSRFYKACCFIYKQFTTKI
jgi:hypothetical protein